MSSDLRQHPVAYFALPIFEHIDHDRFEVYCYSYFQGQEDAIQKDIASRVTAFRWNPEISNADAAQLIADDQLDILFELGGSTAMNRLEVMAYSPARKQASWLGYPHSAGLTTIDYLVADPFIVPPDATLMLEQPLMMPRSWISLGRQIFNDRAEITATLPEDRAGYITYGTANNPHKYNEAVLRTWARIVAATPGSKFEFLRPESGSAAFRKNIERYFEMEGVSADRLVFRAIRGAHLPYYNEIDITLDPFPLTGGTTTCEALWMGVPVISLCGEAFFERLSHSILHNSGVGHHSVDSLEAYVRTALALAGDRAQRQELRHALREQMRNGPLGRAEDYARDFYEAVARTLRG
jgi:predicted O-linked N-acetylglucosamine transferase (SPINDLY family)